MRKILIAVAAVTTVAGCQMTAGPNGVTEATPEPYRSEKIAREAITDVHIATPRWHAPMNAATPHPWPAANPNSLPAARMFNLLKHSERVRIQQNLAEMGLYADRIDGKWGWNTWEAVRAYSSRTGMSSYLLDTEESLNVFRSIAG